MSNRPTDAEIMQRVIDEAEASGRKISKYHKEFLLKFAGTIGKFTEKQNVKWVINDPDRS